MGLFGKKKPPIKQQWVATPTRQVSAEDGGQELFDRPSLPARDLEPLLVACADQLRSRGLETPLLFLPFRPASDLPATRAFIRQWHAFGWQGDELRRELLICDVLVLAALFRWGMTRIDGGLLDWSTYLLFRSTEEKLRQDRTAFQQIVPVLIVDPAKQSILLAFLELLSAVAAHVAVNGHPARKLARQCAAFFFGHELAPQLDAKPTPFQIAYTRWKTAAAASEHLLVSYLRGHTMLPKALEKMLKEDAYPLLPTSDNNVCFWTSLQSPKISANPRVLAQRILLHLQARREIAPHSDPLDTLTEESQRMLRGFEQISSNHSEKVGENATEIDWLDFQDFGFDAKYSNEARRNRDERVVQTARPAPHPHTIAPSSAKPAHMPNWQQFMEVGLSGTLVYRQPIPRSDLLADSGPLETSIAVTYHSVQQEQAALDKGRVDAGFWGAWMNAMAGESSPLHRSIFGRSLVVKLKYPDAVLVLEELFEKTATVETVPDKQKKRLMSFRKEKPPERQPSSVRKTIDGGRALADSDLVVAMRLKKLLDDHRPEQKMLDAGPQAYRPVAVQTVHRREESVYDDSIGQDVKKMLRWAEKSDAAASAELPTQVKPVDASQRKPERKPVLSPAMDVSVPDTASFRTNSPVPAVKVESRQSTLRGQPPGFSPSQVMTTINSSQLLATQNGGGRDVSPSGETTLPKRESRSRPSTPRQRRADGRIQGDMPLYPQVSISSHNHPPPPPIPADPRPSRDSTVSQSAPKFNRFWQSRKSQGDIKQVVSQSPAVAYAEPPIVRRHSPEVMMAESSPLPTLVPSKDAHASQSTLAAHNRSTYEPAMSFELDEPEMHWKNEFDPAGSHMSVAPSRTRNRFAAIEDEANALQRELFGDADESPLHLRKASDASSRYSDGGGDGSKRKSLIRSAHQHVIRKMLSQTPENADEQPIPEPPRTEQWERRESMDQRMVRHWASIKSLASAAMVPVDSPKARQATEPTETGPQHQKTAMNGH
ncbi:hypothetical protein BCR37DRAFT_392257 [Protomyces lactucae-debilis]|uniref:Meiotically up-regulated protein Msb1/Mug8 domain-containing protein n=1 Tax=Protomyces lactucae-debilis TaxID=2754530 RepID=A0A1Y2FJN8_PROLT|nr:uncharacterized protein BCR37DRAFT_392257 [Protomyces lactucae-debilis]ORY83807.1 hypothetical protein BCR37DRAFT_392257 [Protomyces lactucae-debilis]